MTHHPYTDTNLRTEAAHQHANLTKNPNFMSIGEQMDTRPTWNRLDEHHFDAAQDAVHNLITGAANLSTWAVNLGADHLEPDPHVIDLDDNGQPTVRVHFAFHPDMTDTERHHLLTAASRALQTAADESR